MITATQLQKIYPRADVRFVQPLNDHMQAYGIVSLTQIAAFIAQACHESTGFNHMRESLAYTPVNLLLTFPKYIHSLEQAQSLVKSGQIAIADAVYGGREGNNTNGDGYKYRGGGPFGLTFKNNYDQVGKAIGYDLLNHPELITDPNVAVLSACQFWKDNNLSHWLIQGYDYVSRVINAGPKNATNVAIKVNGLNERRALYQTALGVLKSTLK